MSGAADLQKLARQVIAAGSSLWPEIEVSTQAVVSAIGEYGWSLPDENARRSAFIAVAAVSGNERAHAVIDELVLSLSRRISHMNLAPSMLEDVMQQTRQELLVGAGNTAPALLRYADHGKLSGLVVLIATRKALSLLRKESKLVARDDDWFALAFDDKDLPQELAKNEAAAAFRKCFADAVAKLTPRDRNVLRLSLRSPLSQTEIAAMYKVHGATLRRWIAQIRESLLAETRRTLGRELALSTREVESLIAFTGSRLDASWTRLLGTSD